MFKLQEYFGLILIVSEALDNVSVFNFVSRNIKSVYSIFTQQRWLLITLNLSGLLHYTNIYI